MAYLPLFALVATLLLLFVCALRRPPQGKPGEDSFSHQDDYSGVRHITFLPQIQQTFSTADLEYLAKRGSKRLARRVRQERRETALRYVAALHEDFRRLLRLARVIAVLSPEVRAVHEFERLKLSIRFAWRYRLLRVMLHLELASVPQLSSLSDTVSAFALGIQGVMNELGERAALAAEMASSLERGSVDLS